jgi:hypothetical protein
MPFIAAMWPSGGNVSSAHVNGAVRSKAVTQDVQNRNLEKIMAFSSEEGWQADCSPLV